MQRRLLVAVLALAAVLAGPGAASAQISSADQYVEDVPTSTGGVQGTQDQGGGGGGGTTTPLSPAAEQALANAGGADATALRHVATSSALGAPSESLRGVGTPRDQDRQISVAGALSQGIGALAGVDAQGSSAALLAALALVTAAIAAFAVRRSRRGRTS
jgi:hypothetical protein